MLDGLDPSPRWLAFDAVGTLVYPDPPVDQVYWEAAQRAGSKLGPAQIKERFALAFRQSERNDLQGMGDDAELVTSEENEVQRWRKIVEVVLNDVPDVNPAFCELYAHFAAPTSWKCFEDVADGLEQLAAKGYRLAMASNFDSRLEGLCHSLEPLRRIEQCVISSLVGFRKPSHRFFGAMLETLGCDRSGLLMIGDDDENDVEGARRAGIRAVAIRRKGPAGPGEISVIHDLWNRR